jgi:hypothetical protein
MSINAEQLSLSPYKDKINYFISNTDINKYFPEAKIIKFSNLDQFPTIYDLLPKSLDFVFILVEEQENVGHWQVLVRNDHEFNFFDSYGDEPTTILNFIPKYMNKLLGNEKSDIGHILKSINKKSDKLTINKFQFQSNTEGVNTCGRHCIGRVCLFLEDDMNMAAYLKYMKKKQKESKLSYDELICILISI